MIRIVAVLVILYTAWRALLVLRMWLYVRRSQSRPLSGYTPRVAVIVPCWEAHPHLETRMRALLEQDYPDHRVIFATGSTADPAWSILNRLAGQRPRVTLVNSGRPTTCSQKVHNSLRALQEVGHAEVYVFADSDAQYSPTWLRHLVSPLDDPEVGATTGCFWWEPSGGGLWTRVLAWGFNTQIVPFFAGDTLTFAWGGSMAIKATTFRQAGIADIWQNVAYDDLTLAAALSARRLKMPFVPEALVNVPVSDGRPGWCLNWLKREMVAGKVYNPRMYRLALLLTVPLTMMVMSPLILLVSSFMPGLRPVGLLLFSILPIRMITGALFCLAVGRSGTALYALLDYLGVVLGLVGTYLSIFTRRFTWGDLTYTLLSPRKTRVTVPRS